MFRRLLLATGLFCLAQSQLQAAAAPVDTTAARLDAITAAAARCERRHAGDADCRALATIDRAMAIQLDAERTTVGLPRPRPADRDWVAERRWRRLLARQTRPASLCQVATDIAARYQTTDDDSFVASTLIELAFRLDRHVGTDCLGPMLARMPRTAPVDALIATEHDFCAGTWHFGVACGAIGRP